MIELEKKEILIATINFLLPYLLFPFPILSISHYFWPTDSGDMCKYVKIYASTYVNIRTYVGAINSTYINMLTSNNTLTYTKINPNFRTKN